MYFLSMVCPFVFGVLFCDCLSVSLFSCCPCRGILTSLLDQAKNRWSMQLGSLNEVRTSLNLCVCDREWLTIDIKKHMTTISICSLLAFETFIVSRNFSESFGTPGWLPVDLLTLSKCCSPAGLRSDPACEPACSSEIEPIWRLMP